MLEGGRTMRARGTKRIRIAAIKVREALIAWYVRRGYVKTGEESASLQQRPLRNAAPR